VITKEDEMKIKKTMTAAATAANRDNSKKSTGPKTERGKSVACRNSVRHGILAKKLGFQNPAKRAEYEEIWQWWTKYFRPRGPLEEYLVQEITNTVWKLRLTETLEMKELSQRQSVKDSIGGMFSYGGSRARSCDCVGFRRLKCYCVC